MPQRVPLKMGGIMQCYFDSVYKSYFWNVNLYDKKMGCHKLPVTKKW